MRIGLPVGAVLASIGVGFAGVSSAQSATPTTATNTQIEKGMGMRGERPAVMGKITSITGTTLTVESMNRGQQSGTTYTVETASAKILKAGQGTTPSEIAVTALVVGDMVGVRGTVSGTNVSATQVISGMLMRGGHGKHGTRGTVSAINGSTITLIGDNGTTYTVDAASATVGKITTIQVGDIQVGDSLDVMGEVTGTTVTAKHIMDGVQTKPLK